MNRENLTQWDINLINMLGYTVRLYDGEGNILCVGKLHTHKDEVRIENFKAKVIEKTLKYFSITPQDAAQWVFSYSEINTANNDFYYIQLKW